MSLYPQAPQSIGQTIDSGFRMYRQIFKQVLPLSVLIAVLSQVPQLPQLLMSGEAPAAPGALALGILVLMIPWLIAYFAFYNGWLLALDTLAQGKPALSFGETFRGGKSKIWPAFVGGFGYGLFVMLGTLLLVIPGIYLATAMLFFWYFVVLEDMAGGASLKASRELVKGYWWHTATVFTVAGLIYLVALMVFGGIAGVVFGVSAAGSLGRGAEGMKAAAPLIKLLMVVVQIALNTLLLPLWNCITLVLFRDLKMRKSGADLAARAATA